MIYLIAISASYARQVDGTNDPDDFPPILFKGTTKCIAELLPLIFSSVMSVGKTPGEWSHTVVTPVYKDGPVYNCRPRSLSIQYR